MSCLPSDARATGFALARRRAAASGGPAVIPLTLPSGKVLQVEVMVNDEDRAMGLMFRPSLPEDHGLIFVFEQIDFHGFWMKNCKFPIDMVWLDEDARSSTWPRACRRASPTRVRSTARAARVVRRRAERGPGAAREGGPRLDPSLPASALTPRRCLPPRPTEQPGDQNTEQVERDHRQRQQPSGSPCRATA